VANFAPSQLRRPHRDPQRPLDVDSRRLDSANTGHSSATQHAESDRPGATLAPLAWRLLVAELAVSSGSVLSCTLRSHQSRSQPIGLVERPMRALVTTPIPKSPECTPQRYETRARSRLAPAVARTTGKRVVSMRQLARRWTPISRPSGTPRVASAVRSLRQR
jgi:hypothetical protein